MIGSGEVELELGLPFDLFVAVKLGAVVGGDSGEATAVLSFEPPDQTEQALYQVVPKRYWPKVNLYLVTWGQNVCRPVYPRCPVCVVSPHCPKIGVRVTQAGA